jgi:hypothetical protein
MTQIDREGQKITFTAMIQAQFPEGTQQAGQEEQRHDGQHGKEVQKD